MITLLRCYAGATIIAHGRHQARQYVVVSLAHVPIYRVFLRDVPVLSAQISKIQLVDLGIPKPVPVFQSPK